MYSFAEKGSHVSRLTSTLLYSPGWLWRSRPPALNSQVLWLQWCTVTHSVFKKEGTSERRRRSQAWRLMPIIEALGVLPQAQGLQSKLQVNLVMEWGPVSIKLETSTQWPLFFADKHHPGSSQCSWGSDPTLPSSHWILSKEGDDVVCTWWGEIENTSPDQNYQAREKSKSNITILLS